MFDKDLFYSLCGKYNVELSETASKPMIREGSEVHVVTGEDVTRVFASGQAHFGYTSNTISAKIVSSEFYLQDSLAIAC